MPVPPRRAQEGDALPLASRQTGAPIGHFEVETVRMCVDDIRRCRRHQSALDVESSGITGARSDVRRKRPERTDR